MQGGDIRLTDGHAVGVVGIDIEQLVTWALRDQGLGWDASGSSTLLGRFAALGTMVSGGMVADPSVALLSDTDAIVVRQAIDGLDREPRMLVLTHGRAGTRPEWHPEGMGEPQPLTGGGGAVRVEYADERNRHGRAGVRLDMLAWSKRVEEVEHDRGQWTAWRWALLTLGAAVNGRMSSHRATGPAALAEPWADAATVAAEVQKRAHDDAQGGGMAQAAGISSDPAIAGMTIAELRAEAQAAVRSRASDWGGPDVLVREPLKQRVRRESQDDAGGSP